MKENFTRTAPIERVFRSIEGETSRVGEVTTFLKIGDGQHQTAEQALAQVKALGPSHTLVINTCAAMYGDWRHFVEELACMASNEDDYKVVIETRGELQPQGPFPMYLWLTEGVTTVQPTDMESYDELKVLVHKLSEIADAVERLLPWANAGYQCFIFPRVKTHSHAAFFEAFLALNPPRNIRMMLVEHEVIGID